MNSRRAKKRATAKLAKWRTKQLLQRLGRIYAYHGDDAGRIVATCARRAGKTLLNLVPF